MAVSGSRLCTTKQVTGRVRFVVPSWASRDSSPRERRVAIGEYLPLRAEVVHHCKTMIRGSAEQAELESYSSSRPTTNNDSRTRDRPPPNNKGRT